MQIKTCDFVRKLLFFSLVAWRICEEKNQVEIVEIADMRCLCSSIRLNLLCIEFVLVLYWSLVLVYFFLL